MRTVLSEEQDAKMGWLGCGAEDQDRESEEGLRVEMGVILPDGMDVMDAMAAGRPAAANRGTPRLFVS